MSIYTLFDAVFSNALWISKQTQRNLVDSLSLSPSLFSLSHRESLSGELIQSTCTRWRSTIGSGSVIKRDILTLLDASLPFTSLRNCKHNGTGSIHRPTVTIFPEGRQRKAERYILAYSSHNSVRVVRLISFSSYCAHMTHSLSLFPYLSLSLFTSSRNLSA